MPTAALFAPTVPSVILPFAPEAKVRLCPAPVMFPASMAAEDVMERLPPMVIFPKSTDPESMVSAPDVVRAALPVMLPRDQVPAVQTAADEDRARMPTSVPSAPILPRVMVPEPEVNVTLEVPRSVPRVILSLEVVLEKAPLGVVAPSVA